MFGSLLTTFKLIWQFEWEVPLMIVLLVKFDRTMFNKAFRGGSGEKKENIQDLEAYLASRVRTR